MGKVQSLYERYFVDPFRHEAENEERDKEVLRQVSTFVSNPECQRLQDWLEGQIRAAESGGPVEHGQSLFNSGLIRGLRMVQDRIHGQRQIIKEGNHE